MRVRVRNECVLLTVVAFSLGLNHACAQAQDSPTTFGSETSLPPVEKTDQTPDEKSSKASQTPNTQMPQFQTSVQEATNAGLVPTLSGGASLSQAAGGFVPTFPGLTSNGAGAASAAANSQKFLTVYATQSIAYADNPGQLFGGQTTASSQSSSLDRPDFYEVSSGGVLLSKQLGLQNLFASANFGETQYFHDKNFDSTRYSFSLGVNYAISDVCSGVVVANQSQSAVPLELSVASLSSQTSQDSSIEVSSRCRATGYLYTTSDFRLGTTGFTGSTNSANNSMQLFGSGGLEYSVPGFVTMGLLSSIQDTNFTDRSALGTGLANQTSQISFNGYISKPLSKKLNVSLSAGIVDLATGGPSFAGSIQPIYSATLSYAYSPKTSFNFNYSHLTGSPQSIVANFQEVETISLGVNYRFSPKLSFGASLGRSSTSSSGTTSNLSGTTPTLGIPLPLIGSTLPIDDAFNTAADTKTMTEQLSARYSLAPNASASLSYQHIQRTQSSIGEAKENVVSFSVSYRR